MYATALKWSALVGGVALAIGAIFFLGSSYKDSQWQSKWDKAELAKARAIDALKTEIGTKEDQHRDENSKLRAEIQERERLHAVAVAAVRAEYVQRVRLSESRALVYQRQAEGGTAQCRSLADHAARLDRSLEEGRSVVRELRIVVGQRDDAIRSLSTQILADRKLFE